MPDHLHLVVQGTSADADLRWFVRLAKQHSAYELAQLRGTRLWQPSYHDHVIRHERAILPAIRYVLENPVRAGLVASIRDYPFVGSSVWSIDELIDLVGTCEATSASTSTLDVRPEK